ncbi:hypothetical protein EmuJ_001030600 [Echinococcus multilocularis]|uniref:Uncharacterized protein n=1 Tax=Echinococcus multilocularis TaxID=6211 RepID=A0A068YK96_ECHMU|nr:hypothetical protein EmuJ_001030600 [Echinococcus multilocularis]
MSRLQPGSLHNTVNPRTDHALLAYANTFSTVCVELKYLLSGRLVDLTRALILVETKANTKLFRSILK